MTTFYFNVRDGDMLALDPEGSVLADIKAARSEAVDSAREMVAWLVRSGMPIDGQRIEVTDDAGTLHATVTFREVIRFT